MNCKLDTDLIIDCKNLDDSHNFDQELVEPNINSQIHKIYVFRFSGHFRNVKDVFGIVLTLQQNGWKLLEVTEADPTPAEEGRRVIEMTQSATQTETVRLHGMWYTVKTTHSPAQSGLT